MGGLSGFLYFREDDFSTRNELLSNMSSTLIHRGGACEERFLDKSFALAYQRFYHSYTDNEHPNFPGPLSGVDSSGHIFSALDGEIYNAAFLREELTQRGHRFKNTALSKISPEDPELIAHLYAEYGHEEMLRKLRGKFALAIWDLRNRCLILARDRLGQKPLYFYRNTQICLFASELNALLASGLIPQDLHPEALEDYFTLGMIPETRCIYKNVEKIPPAAWVLIQQDTEKITRGTYWNVIISPDSTLGENQWLEAVREKFSQTLRTLRCGESGDVNAFLSGGLDSSMVVGELCDWNTSEKHPHVHTFNMGFSESNFNEAPYALAVSNYFGTDHHAALVTTDAVDEVENLVRIYDEPYADSSALPTMLLARFIRQTLGTERAVLFSGDGADEAFSGYARHLYDLREAHLRNLIPGCLRNSLGALSSIWPKADWLPRFLRFKNFFRNLSLSSHYAYVNTLCVCRTPLRDSLLSYHTTPWTSFQQKMAEVYALPYTHGISEKDALCGMTQLDLALLPSGMIKVDRACMNAGLEVRSVFNDHELIELAARIPSHLKIRNGLGKWIMRHLYEPHLPEILRNRRKQGFELPVDAWLRGPLQDVFRETVLKDSSNLLAEWINLHTAEKLLDHHRHGVSTYGNILWCLLILGVWLKHH